MKFIVKNFIFFNFKNKNVKFIQYSKQNLILLGDKSSRRVTDFHRALRQSSLSCTVIDWNDWLSNNNLDQLTDLCKDALIRIDSPGGSWKNEQKLLLFGAYSLGKDAQISEQDVLQLVEDRGLVRFGRQRYAGFLAATKQWIDLVKKAGASRIFPDLDAIALSFDKRKMHQKMDVSNIRVAPTIQVSGDLEEIFHHMNHANISSVFLKPRYGSSAGGMMALRKSGKKHVLIAPVAWKNERLYQERRFHRYADINIIRKMVQTLFISEDLHIEEWIPKPTFAGGPADLRILVVNKIAALAVARIGFGPMTNLHLGSRRLPWSEVKAHLGKKTAHRLFQEAEKVAALLPNSLSVGVDLAWTPASNRPIVYEANIFGDLIVGIHDENGRNSYDLQVEALCEKTI